MFARLYEGFLNERRQDGTQPTFLESQTKYYKSIKHIIPSATSGLEFDDASKAAKKINEFLVNWAQHRAKNAENCSLLAQSVLSNEQEIFRLNEFISKHIG